MATMEKKGMPTGLFVDASAHRRAGRGLGRQLRADGLRRRRRDGRARARRARLRVREEVRPADQAGDRRRRRGVLDRRLAAVVRRQGARPLRLLGQVRRARPMRRRSTRSPPTSPPRAWARRRSRIACATGASRASATGARRSRSSTATRAAPCRCRRRTCPSCCPRTASRTAAATRCNKRADFLNVACPKCGKPARRETDTMDTFVDSSWYYMRYTCPGAPTMVDARNDYWMPMDQYIGGIEHAILHLLYARFWTKVMRDLGLVKIDEPFTRLLTQGMLLNHIYFRRNAKGGIDYFPPDEVDVDDRRRGPHRPAAPGATAQPVEYGGVGKMGKSERNGVDPQDADRQVRRRHRAPVRDVRRHARGLRDLVRRRRRRRVPLPEAPVDVRAGARGRRARRGRRASTSAMPTTRARRRAASCTSR